MARRGVSAAMRSAAGSSFRFAPSPRVQTFREGLSGEATLLAQLPAPRKRFISKIRSYGDCLETSPCAGGGAIFLCPGNHNDRDCDRIRQRLRWEFQFRPRSRSASHIDDGILDDRVGTSRPSPDVYGHGGEGQYQQGCELDAFWRGLQWCDVRNALCGQQRVGDSDYLHCACSGSNTACGDTNSDFGGRRNEDSGGDDHHHGSGSRRLGNSFAEHNYSSHRQHDDVYGDGGERCGE
jgi:hypothetical protein